MFVRNPSLLVAASKWLEEGIDIAFIPTGLFHIFLKLFYSLLFISPGSKLNQPLAYPRTASLHTGGYRRVVASHENKTPHI